MANGQNGAGPQSGWFARLVGWVSTELWAGITWVARHIAGPWWAIRDVLRVFWACRAPMLSVVIGGALIALTDQARDIVMASAVAKGGFWSGLGLIATMIAWAGMSWYWARVTLNFSFSLPEIEPDAAAWCVSDSGPLARWRRLTPYVVCPLALLLVVAAIVTERSIPAAVAAAIIAVILAFWIMRGAEGGRPVRWRRWWRRQAPRIIGAVAILSVAAAFWKAHNVYGDAGDKDYAAHFKWWSWGFIGLAVLFYVAVAERTKAARLLGAGGPRTRYLVPTPDAVHDRLRDYANPVAFAVLAFSVLLSPALFIWFVVDPVGAADSFGGAVRAILFGLATMVPVISLLALLARRLRLPLFGATFLWLAVAPALFGDNHDIRFLNAGADPSPLASRQKLGDVFQRWWSFNARPEMTRPLAVSADGEDQVVAPPFVVVATAGGASRAAFWTSQVLGEISAREPGFADRLFMVSGVSGGSLGAVAYRSIVEADRRAVVGDKPLVQDDPARRARVFLERDFLTPAMAAGLYVDLPWRTFSFLPRSWQPDDRAAALEKAWEAAWRESTGSHSKPLFDWSQGFVSTFAGVGQGDAYRPWPILALNGTSVEKGKRIVTSNASFGGGQISGDVNRYDAFDMAGRDMPISTAVTMSARFPLISPAGGLRDGHGRMITRVIDGGLFENFGAATAEEILRYVVERRADVQTGRRPVVPIAILISSDPSLDHLDRQTSTGYREQPIDNLPPTPDCAAVAGMPRGSVATPVPHPGNRWPECPVVGRESGSLIGDPIFALYDGRVARGEQAATAMLDRIDENRAGVRRQIAGGLARIARHDADQSDKTTGANAAVGGADDKVNARVGTSDHVDFFHFRQCRVPGQKGPTMSWHDSQEAWRVMRAMTGLEPGAGDPCGNAVEFFRLCVRLARLSGVADNDKAASAFCETDRKWPRPKAWQCDEFGDGTHRRWWCRMAKS